MPTGLIWLTTALQLGQKILALKLVGKLVVNEAQVPVQLVAGVPVLNLNCCVNAVVDKARAKSANSIARLISTPFTS
jgi:hypothetical protein